MQERERERERERESNDNNYQPQTQNTFEETRRIYRRKKGTKREGDKHKNLFFNFLIFFLTFLWCKITREIQNKALRSSHPKRLPI